MYKKVKISFIVPVKLQQDVKVKMAEEGYGIRNKSQWIIDAMLSLIKHHSFIDLVKVNDEMSGFEKLETIWVDKSLKLQLEQLVVEVRKKYPGMNGVQSRILRTAILQKLL